MSRINYSLSPLWFKVRTISGVLWAAEGGRERRLRFKCNCVVSRGQKVLFTTDCLLMKREDVEVRTAAGLGWLYTERETRSFS